jgi:hypothetical protein
MSKKIIFILIISVMLISSQVSAIQTLAQTLSGRILLQVESRGEAWYINTADFSRYYLGKPADAWQIMREFGIGISNNDLKKIPIGLTNYASQDSDNDGLPDNLESAIGTDPDVPDSDGDNFSDKIEVINNYNPLGQGKIYIDKNFFKNNAGKIFLQTENKGEAWYVNPKDFKRYFLGRPADAFAVMGALGLGISNSDLNQIKIGSSMSQSNNQNNTPNNSEVINSAATAIRQGNTDSAKSYFTANMARGIEYMMNSLTADSRLILGNILSGSKLSSSTDTEKIYTNEVYFSMGGYKVPVKFIEQKQNDGTWKLVNL